MPRTALAQPNVIRAATIMMCVACCYAHAQDQAPVRRTPGEVAFIKAIDMAPADAISVAVVPSAQSLGEDMGELAAKLQRMQALTEMKPLRCLIGGANKPRHKRAAIIHAWTNPKLTFEQIEWFHFS